MVENYTHLHLKYQNQCYNARESRSVNFKRKEKEGDYALYNNSYIGSNFIGSCACAIRVYITDDVTQQNEIYLLNKMMISSLLVSQFSPIKPGGHLH